jgi:stage II sporulation protein D
VNGRFYFYDIEKAAAMIRAIFASCARKKASLYTAKNTRPIRCKGANEKKLSYILVRAHNYITNKSTNQVSLSANMQLAPNWERIYACAWKMNIGGSEYMKRIKPLIALLSFLFVVVLLIPTVLVIPFNDGEVGKLAEELRKQEKVPNAKATENGPAVEVAVYRSKEKRIERIPLEQYVIGVVAAEMPAEFEMEALKAQALTARTYIVKQLLNDQPISLPKGANVTDTIMHQVYYSNDELKRLWGSDYEWKIKKITEAVQATRGQILTYDNKPIEASFFSTSNGFTENSEAYWQNEFPYLKSVASPWDEKSPKFYHQKVMSVDEFEQKLGVKLPQDGSVGVILSRTPGKRVDVVEINGKKLKGREVREKLDLTSTDFTWVRKGDQIVITTKGYGHGVGMSQYGANFMAKEGKTYDQIVKYYYRGVKISSATAFLNKLTVKK